MKKRGLEDDRIRVPMLRGHDGKMKEVSWDEALDRAAWLFLHAREWVGPEAVAIYGNGQKTIEDIWLASLYKLVFKLPTIGANSEHCLTSAGAAHTLNFGNEASFTWQEFDELAECDVAILHGTNPFVTFPQAYEKLKNNQSARKVVIDPVFNDSASDLTDADPRTVHIPFRQGGDVLFNLSVARVIFDHGWEDQASLEQRVDPSSLHAFKALCSEARCAPDEAAKRIALPGQDPSILANMIREHAELIAKPRDGYRPKVAFVSSMGVNQSTGSYGFSTNLNLLLLTGNVGRRGAGSLRIAGQSNATSELMMGFNGRRMVFNLDPGNAAHRKALAKSLDLPEENFPTEVGTPVARMAENDHLYCFIFIGTQMTKNMPRVGYWARRLGRSFNIVIDSFLGEGVLEHADVLLPSMTYTERTGVIQRGDRTLQLQQQVTEPPPEAWSDSKILINLALKIAERLRDPDTADLNELDPEVVHRTFHRYLDSTGEADSAGIFDHLVSVNRELELYSRLENAKGQAISHALIKQNAGKGVQWGGNGRYQDLESKGDIFPELKASSTKKAKLVCPPDEFMARLEAPLPEGTLSLISGRGRPGRKAMQGRARYNSGIKTLPIYGVDPNEHFVEVHPTEAKERQLEEGSLVRMLSGHGAVIARVAVNDRIARGAAFIDFVPGEVNRLTDYVDADQFTHQSLIKRTPVQLQSLRSLEHALWHAPDSASLEQAIACLYQDWRKLFAKDEDWIQTQFDDPDEIRWLPPEQLRDPKIDAEEQISEAVGALTVFFQQYMADPAYQKASGEVLRNFDASTKDTFLRIFLPLIRRLDYQSVMHPILADFVGSVRVVDGEGNIDELDLMSAHKSAVLEFKEEIVAIQLFIAIKRGIEQLYGPGAVVNREDLAFVSGIAIPCAGDVPAHFLGISPADLGSALLVHSRAIGINALIIVDRKNNRAVRVNVHTGVLPKDKELGYLRGQVINHKRTATGKEHRRFFDRLGELIVDYVRTGDDNFTFSGPTSLDWEEYRNKLSFSPPNSRGFANYLHSQGVSKALAESFVSLGILDEVRDAEAINAIRNNVSTTVMNPSPFDPQELYAGTLKERVDRVVAKIIAPVLANDGGRLDVLDIDESTGVLVVRFVGSCANCPYSLLSMEQIVNPSLLAIPGVTSISYRAKAREKELAAQKGKISDKDNRIPALSI
jgi:anaerobic selenocysteine-containing dehydrogenase/Fe-S cluster biogenesis protein NfuA